MHAYIHEQARTSFESEPLIELYLIAGGKQCELYKEGYEFIFRSCWNTSCLSYNYNFIYIVNKLDVDLSRNCCIL